MFNSVFFGLSSVLSFSAPSRQAIRILVLIITSLIGVSLQSFSQCQVYDGGGAVSANPVWVSCSGGTYALYIQSPNNFGALTINWGDGSANTTVTSLISPAFVSHVYAAVIGNYTVTIAEAGTGGCVITGLVVLEEPVNASMQIPLGGVTQTCAPGTLLFTNTSTDVSSNTEFTWDFGDGSTIETYGDTNVNQTVSHTYLQGTVNCVTQVTLTAENYCSFGTPTTASFNPIQIFDLDEAEITASSLILCYPLIRWCTLTTPRPKTVLPKKIRHNVLNTGISETIGAQVRTPLLIGYLLILQPNLGITLLILASERML